MIIICESLKIAHSSTYSHNKVTSLYYDFPIELGQSSCASHRKGAYLINISNELKRGDGDVHG